MAAPRAREAVKTATPRAPTVAPKKGPAQLLEVITVPGEGKALPPSVTYDSLKWRQEVRPATEQPPKLFTGRLEKLRPKGYVSKAQWRKFFADPILRRFAHAKAHATKGGPKIRYRRLPGHKRS